ncbi:kinesin light chain [Lizonia empirigonia]|nr:kinesin light chain [Lizonia empirigonia]
MPITYGEGKESARRRLQAELDATGSAPSIIPFLQNESFVAKLFSNNQTTTTLAILSYLPLAVVQAAACINASHITVQQYRTQLAEHKEAALEFSDDPPEGEVRESGLRKTVAATLNAVAADYLFLAACVDRKDILLDFLEATSPRTREDAIKVLGQYALVTRRPAESALDVHRLVHYALRKRMEAEGRLQECTQRTITRLV